MDKATLLARTDELIEQGKEVLKTKSYSDWEGNFVNSGMQAGFKSASLSFIRSLYSEDHPFFKEFKNEVSDTGPHHTEIGINILKSVRNEIDKDLLFSIRQLISADIFSDFLEMAKHLLDENYKDPSAVMIGSVLEEHLRFLCQKHHLPIEFLNNKGEYIPKKADALNADLKKSNIYNSLQQKNVTAWLDLRNKAAHGKYNEYTKPEVEVMYLGVLNFVNTTN